MTPTLAEIEGLLARATGPRPVSNDVEAWSLRIRANDRLKDFRAYLPQLIARIRVLESGLRKIAENDSDGLHMFTPQAMQKIARDTLEGER